MYTDKVASLMCDTSGNKTTSAKVYPLTVDEVNAYGEGHVNAFAYDTITFVKDTAYNQNGYGGMAYYHGKRYFGQPVTILHLKPGGRLLKYLPDTPILPLVWADKRIKRIMETPARTKNLVTRTTFACRSL